MRCISRSTIRPMRTLFHVAFSLFLTGAGAVALAQQPQRQDEFVPVSELPATEQLPAAPLLVGAYVFVLVVLFVYVLSIARRVGAVQQEVQRLEGELKSRSRS
jgi:CcmD family protein